MNNSYTFQSNCEVSLNPFERRGNSSRGVRLLFSDPSQAEMLHLSLFACEGTTFGNDLFALEVSFKPSGEVHEDIHSDSIDGIRKLHDRCKEKPVLERL